jgi:hypothetical protein
MILLKAAPKAYDDAVFFLRGRIAEDLPDAIGIVAHQQDGVAIPHDRER